MKKILVLIVSVSVFLFLGCSTSTQPSEGRADSKELSLAFALPCQSQDGLEIKSAYVYVTGNDFDTIVEELSVASCKATGKVSDIPQGKDRHIELKVFDVNDKLCYYGDSYVLIEIGVISSVVIKLKKIDQTGSIDVTGIICDNSNDIPQDTAQLNLTGCWQIQQSNNHWGTLEFTQSGDSITGYASFETHSNGSISGKVFGDSVYFRITYPTGDGYGDYYSKLNTHGSIIQGWGRGSDGQTATWKIVKGNCNDTIISCWDISQSNNHVGTLQFVLTGDSLSGFSRFTTHSNGPISGKLVGDSLIFRITYPAGQGYGDYYGKFGIYGESIQGWGKGSDGQTATWNAALGNCEDTADNPDSSVFTPDSFTIALYHFDEDSGNILLDASGNGWHGNLKSGKRVVGVNGKGIFFDYGDIAEFDTILNDGLEQGTIELYFKLNKAFNSDSSYILFGNDGSRCNLLLTEGRLMFMKNHSDIFRFISAPVDLQEGKWYHVAATWGSKGMKIFLDGMISTNNSDVSCYQSSPRTSLENKFFIGQKSSCCMNGADINEPLSFSGYLDEIHISSIERY